jgi:hypothetical protein
MPGNLSRLRQHLYRSGVDVQLPDLGLSHIYILYVTLFLSHDFGIHKGFEAFDDEAVNKQQLGLRGGRRRLWGGYVLIGGCHDKCRCSFQSGHYVSQSVIS